jgi:hypothetical protein
MEVSFFFNADSESFLKGKRANYTIESNKINQEFEYFILWLEDESLYSTKKYSQEYVDFISKFKKVSISRDKKNVKTWCCDLSNKKESQDKNSKIKSTMFAIDKKLCHESTQIIDDLRFYEEGYLYKEEFGVSGSGNFNFCDKRKLTLPLVKEKALKRTFDFSALIEKDNTTIYQNHIDDYFQYKGTTLGLNFEYFEWIGSYKRNLELIRNEFFSGTPLSVDSFLYEEEKEEKVYTLTEINNRKTMGYITKELRNKFFNKYKYIRLRLFSTSKLLADINYEGLYKYFSEKVVPLSPVDNKFMTFLIMEDSLGELNELEDLLVSTFFKDL